MALEKIGPYKFQGILGRGGMGTVYRGKHDETDELHAVKILAPTYAHDAHFRGRFESEIKALIKLDHKNIVRLVSFGQEDGMLYFSMELVEGNSLFQMQKKGHRFDWREILAIAKEVSSGLRHAHDRGIIHRDLKPGNLLMTMDSEGKPDYVKITDFGIAKRFGSSQNTGTNVLGTMDFMSPEQAKGEPVTIRSDIYSLGTVLFTLLSGRPPFSSNSVEESLRNLTRVPAPRISRFVPDVPKELDDLIKKLMSKRPDDRIQTAQALIHKINEIETTLRDYSEAKTYHHGGLKIEDDTFDVKAPRTVASTEVGKMKRQITEGNADATSASTYHDENDLVSANTQVDYYNPVTEQLRKSQNEFESPEEKTESSGVLPLALALAAVLLLATYGVYRAFAPPSAETLYTQIEENAEFPNRALDEMDMFLTTYPEDERAESIRELQKIGEAIDLYNGLSNTLEVRRNLPGENRLTAVERQFMEIVDLAQDDSVAADKKMLAFLTVHKNTTDPGDVKCLEAAKSYRLKLQYDSRNKVRFTIGRIRSALKEAGNTTDPEGAIPIYESILELYGNFKWGQGEGATEGRELVGKARELLGVMRAAKKNADEARAQAEAEKARKQAEEKAEKDKAEKEKQDRENDGQSESGSDGANS